LPPLRHWRTFGVGSTPSVSLEGIHSVDPLGSIRTPETFKSPLSFHSDGISALIYRKSIGQIVG